MSCPKIITSSRMRKFLACERSAFYRYQLSYAEDARSDALILGTAIHKGLEEFWLTKTEANPVGSVEVCIEALEEELKKLDAVRQFGPYIRLLALEMLNQYCDKWANDNFIAIAVEEEFLLPLVDSVTGPVDGWKKAGKIDVICKNLTSGKVYLLDHKTAGSNIGPSSSYWTKLKFDHQISMYMLAAKELGYDVVGFIYDVLAKPYSTKPKLATPEEKRKYKKDGSPYAWVKLSDEDPEEYEMRLKQEYETKREQYFVRRSVGRSDAELEEFSYEMIDCAKRIDTQTHVHQALRNTGACGMYGRTCEYMGACSGGRVEEIEGLKKLRAFIELEDHLKGDSK